MKYLPYFLTLPNKHFNELIKSLPLLITIMLLPSNSFAVQFSAIFEPQSQWYTDKNASNARQYVQEFFNELGAEFASPANLKVYLTDDETNASASASSNPLTTSLGKNRPPLPFPATVAWRIINKNYQGHAHTSSGPVPNNGDILINWNFKASSVTRKNIRGLLRHEMQHPLGMHSNAASGKVSRATLYDTKLYFNNHQTPLIELKNSTPIKINTNFDPVYFKGIDQNGQAEWLELARQDLDHLRIYYGQRPEDKSTGQINITDQDRAFYRGLGYKLSKDIFYSKAWENGGCREHFEMPLKQLKNQTEISCAKVCQKNQCGMFFLGRSDDSSGRKGWCNIYPSACSNNGDKTWDAYTLN